MPHEEDLNVITGLTDGLEVIKNKQIPVPATKRTSEGLSDLVYARTRSGIPGERNPKQADQIRK